MDNASSARDDRHSRLARLTPPSAPMAMPVQDLERPATRLSVRSYFRAWLAWV